MNIIGPDALVFGVDDVDACGGYLVAYGLASVGDGRFEALDGTAVVIRHRGDPRLPPAMETGNMLRQIVYGVANEATLDEIAGELTRDRQVQRLAGGAVEALDDHDFPLKFQVTVRRQLDLPGERVNAPGAPPQRGVNQIGVSEDMPAKPRTLSHVVCFVPDIAVAEAFYVKRLGFKVTDRLLNAGPKQESC